MKARLISGLTCALLLSGCAAEQQNVIVKAGRTTAVGFLTTTTVTCDDWSPPKPELVTPPQAGTVSFGVAKAPPANKDRNCDGIPMSGAYTAYTPNKGFHGEDRFSVRWISHSNDGGSTADTATEYVVHVQ